MHRQRTRVATKHGRNSGPARRRRLDLGLLLPLRCRVARGMIRQRFIKHRGCRHSRQLDEVVDQARVAARAVVGQQEAERCLRFERSHDDPVEATHHQGVDQGYARAGRDERAYGGSDVRDECHSRIDAMGSQHPHDLVPDIRFRTERYEGDLVEVGRKR